MKKFAFLGLGLCMALAFTSCKSSESAYKKAYEKAKQQELAQKNLPRVQLKGDSSLMYYVHFTLSRIENGTAHLLNFPEEMKLSAFSNGVPLEPGKYPQGRLRLQGSMHHTH